ncbi:MAG: hypothetical protein SFY81_13485 [Verrucomicrobiota bacterium]|nr:hypothetical protein [Verrucomicrobiota bacterium]
MGTNIIDFLHTTAAYQTAVVQLLTFESEKLAEKLTLAESRPLVVISAEIAPPGFGPSGTISTTNFSYYYSFGQLYSVTRNDAFPKDQDSTNLWKLAGEKSLIDTNGAYQLATQILSRLQIDVAAMEQALPPRVHQMVELRRSHENPEVAPERVQVPLFLVSWGRFQPSYGRVNPVNLTILGTTREIVKLSITTRKFFTNSPVQLTNASELLSPVPSELDIVRRLFSEPGYQIVNDPEKVKLTLIEDLQGADDPIVADRHPPRSRSITLSRKAGKAMSAQLLNFKSYAWGSQKACMPVYGVKAEFLRGGKKVEVLFCFECAILRVKHGGEAREENFDFAFNELLKIIRKEFPRDRELQKIEWNEEEKTWENFLRSLPGAVR